jgi:predicted nucleic acid-binding protein
VIIVDTSALIDSLTGLKPMAHLLRGAFDKGEQVLIPSVVLYEWRRGPRSPDELAAQEAMFPSNEAIVFGTQEAILSAELYRSLTRPRTREIDIAIAATAIIREATLWTTNTADFAGIPNLKFTTRP